MNSVLTNSPRFSPNPNSSFYREVEAVLANFQPITLEEMDHVMLFDRFDQKFILPETFLPTLLKNLSDEYFALEVKSTRIHTYHTRYFDTPSFEHYLAHHNLRKSRFKFRHRIYVESDLHFFEIKEKNKKDRTVKSRVMVKNKIALPGEQALLLVAAATTADGKQLEPKLWSNFHRLTLVHKTRQERMTIDINLILENEHEMHSYEGAVVLELKQEKQNYSAPIVRLLVANGCRPGAMSKYTTGVAQLYPENKSNLFKPTQRLLTKYKNSK